MSVLSFGARVQVVSALVEGISLRATERLTGTGRQAITSLLVNMGDGCERLHDAKVRDVMCDHLQLDEVWAYVGCKEAHKREGSPEEYGDAYTFVGLDRYTKLVPAWRVDKRTAAATRAFVSDLRARVVGKPQVTTDGFRPYIDAISDAWGTKVNYGMSIKHFENEGIDDPNRRYSPGRMVSVEKRVILGSPDEAMMTTSHVERSNLTIRMQQRRFTRLTNAFSKCVRNLRAAVNLHFTHYNWCRPHMTLRVTPAMEAGLADHVWSVEELVEAADAALAAPPPEPLLPPPLPPAPSRRGATFGAMPSGAAPLPGQLPLPGVL